MVAATRTSAHRPQLQPVANKKNCSPQRRSPNEAPTRPPSTKSNPYPSRIRLWRRTLTGSPMRFRGYERVLTTAAAAHGAPAARTPPHARTLTAGTRHGPRVCPAGEQGAPGRSGLVGPRTHAAATASACRPSAPPAPCETTVVGSTGHFLTGRIARVLDTPCSTVLASLFSR